MKKRNGMIVASFLVIVIIGVIIGGMYFSIQDSKAKGIEKVNVVRDYLKEVKYSFEHNESFSCENKKAQIFDNNVSQLNGYTIKYTDENSTSPIQKVLFIKGNLFFKASQCEMNF